MLNVKFRSELIFVLVYRNTGCPKSVLHCPPLPKQLFFFRTSLLNHTDGLSSAKIAPLICLFLQLDPVSSNARCSLSVIQAKLLLTIYDTAALAFNRGSVLSTPVSCHFSFAEHTQTSRQASRATCRGDCCDWYINESLRFAAARLKPWINSEIRFRISSVTFWTSADTRYGRDLSKQLPD